MRLTLLAAVVASLAWKGLAAQESGHDGGRQAAALARSAHRTLSCGNCHVGGGMEGEGRGAVLSCASCHSRAFRDVAADEHGRARARGVPAPTCVGCHGSAHQVRAASDPISAVHSRRVATTCGTCHRAVAAAYDSSVHAGAVRRDNEHAPSCVSCHGGHAIARSRDERARTAPSRVSLATCASCHGNIRLTEKHGLPPAVVRDYQESVHGLSGAIGDRRAANCASCHGIHAILPSSDPSSTIHPSNLGATCGSCHVGAGATFARGGVHHTPTVRGHRLVDTVRRMYLATIVVLIGAMLFHNGIDFVARLRRRRAFPPAHPASSDAYLRFTRGERVQHWVLAGSFMTLALTGFALKFGWTIPGVPGMWNATLRSWSHRVAAVVFMALAAYHVGYLLLTARGRATGRALWPRFNRAADAVCCLASCVRLGPPSVSDWRDLVRTVRYNLGRTATPASFGRFSYAEKMEYFALVWGSIVMALTGLALWLETAFLNRFPYWAIELATTIHLYEAILASLAIVVWHFYFTLFNPDVFPISRVMFTGRIGAEEQAREHPLDSESPHLTLTSESDRSSTKDEHSSK